MLQDFGQESDGREELGVGLEEVRIRRAINDSVRASLVDEQVLQRNGGADDVLSECLSRSGGGGGDTDRMAGPS